MNVNDQHLILVDKSREELVVVIQELEAAKKILLTTMPNKRDQLGKQASMLAAEVMRAAIKARMSAEMYRRTLLATRAVDKTLDSDLE